MSYAERFQVIVAESRLKLTRNIPRLLNVIQVWIGRKKCKTARKLVLRIEEGLLSDELG